MDKYWDKFLKFASLRPRSVKELKFWLLKKKIDTEKQEEYLKKLREFDFLDDKRFAFWWVEQRRTFRPRSKKHLAWELRQKGIDREIIKEALEDVDEIQLAQKLIAKKSFANLQKLQEYLMGRGFDWEAVKEVKLPKE